MTFWEHLIELRSRLIKCLAAVVATTLVSLLWLEPWAFRLALKPLGRRELMYLALGEAFTAHLTFAFYLGLILAIPVVCYQVWAFVSPGLYPREQRMVSRLTLASTALFVAGAAFGYFVMMPMLVNFFLSYEELNFRYGGAIGPYLSLFSGILLGTGLSFQLPLVLLGLIRSGLVKAATLAEQRRYWLLGIVIAAAALTPTGDAATMFIFSLPMYLLFEGAVLYARLRGW